MTVGRLALVVGLLAGAGLPDRPVAAPPAAGPGEDAGRAIYLRGVLGSGAPLVGGRAEGLAASGADAACVNCHQRSGMGSVEGRVSIPPVAGDYLFRSPVSDAGDPALPYAEAARSRRQRYTEETLARAIREGLDAEGKPLNYLMPRFALGDRDMAALIAYLRSLGPRRIPGVTEGVLHFATVITPDADPVKRRGMLDVLESFFLQKNRAPLKPSPALLTSGRTQYAKSMYMANRHWQLHVWELTGPEAGWRAQLERRLAAEPVYALLSGLGGRSWAPVHRFCEDHGLPCLFPNVEVPVVAEGDFYPLYFSKGVLLEVELVGQALLGPEPAAAVEQVFRAGDAGEAAAQALAARLEPRGVRVHGTALPAGAHGAAVAQALRAAVRRAEASGRALVLWLRAPDVATLAEVPARAPLVYLSGLLGGLERTPLPTAWRASARMTYPFDVPDRRGVQLDYPLGWFSARHIPVVAEQVQADTYLACSLVADTLNRTADNFSQPYLIEKLQGLLEHRLITGYYPHLALATNQRFASKGGYLVRFRNPGGPALVAEGDWTVP